MLWYGSGGSPVYQDEDVVYTGLSDGYIIGLWTDERELADEEDEPGDGYPPGDKYGECELGADGRYGGISWDP